MSKRSMAIVSTLITQRPVVRIITASVVMAFMAALAYAFFGPFRHGIDDADITMTYARNIAAGHGYVYEPGGERVEGSTSPLWTAVCAVLFSVSGAGMDAVFVAGLLLTALAIYVALGLAARIAAPHMGNVSVVVAATCFALSPSFIVWSAATLMDTAVWTTCITVGVATVISSRQGEVSRLAAVGVLLVAARPEGSIVAPFLILCSFVASVVRGQTVAKVARGLAIPAIAILAAVLVLVAARLEYFGFPLPNTYYAKVGNNQLHTSLAGISYVTKTLGKQPLLLLGLCAIAYTFSMDARRISSGTNSRQPFDNHGAARLILAAVLVVGALLPIVEGGDHFPGGRLLQPFVPLACVLIAATFTHVFQTNRRLAQYGLLPVLAALGSLGWFRFIEVDAPRLKSEFEIASKGRRIAQFLTEQRPRGERYPSLGVTAAGGVAVTYPGHVYDLLGLNWIAMAHASRERKGIPGHSAFVAKVFWQQPPDMIGLDIQTKRPHDACDAYNRSVAWGDLYLRGLLSTSEFRARFVGFAMPAHDEYLTGFALREWINAEVSWGAVLLSWPVDSAWRRGCSLTSTNLTHD